MESISNNKSLHNTYAVKKIGDDYYNSISKPVDISNDVSYLVNKFDNININGCTSDFCYIKMNNDTLVCINSSYFIYCIDT